MAEEHYANGYRSPTTSAERGRCIRFSSEDSTSETNLDCVLPDDAVDPFSAGRVLALHGGCRLKFDREAMTARPDW